MTDSIYSILSDEQRKLALEPMLAQFPPDVKNFMDKVRLKFESCNIFLFDSCVCLDFTENEDVHRSSLRKRCTPNGVVFAESWRPSGVSRQGDRIRHRSKCSGSGAHHAFTLHVCNL